MLFPLCSCRIHLWYWKNSSGESIYIYGSLCYMLMTSEFMVVNGKLWSRYVWMWCKSSSVVAVSCASSKYSSSYNSGSSVICSSVAFTRGVGLLVSYLVLIKSYVSLKHNGFTLGWWFLNVALGGPYTDFSVSLLNYFSLESCLWSIWMSCPPLFFSWLKGDRAKVISPVYHHVTFIFLLPIYC